MSAKEGHGPGVPADAPHSSTDPLAELRARFLAGEVAAGEAIVVALQDRLLAMARRTRRKQSPSVSLQTQDLVNAAVLKLMRRPPNLKDDRHFLSYLAQTMRHVLIDYHRHRAKRRRAESGFMEQKLKEYELSIRHELPRADELLEQLRVVNPLGAEILQLSVFGGQPMRSIAEVLGRAERTVEREARKARKWLRGELASA